MPGVCRPTSNDHPYEKYLCTRRATTWPKARSWRGAAFGRFKKRKKALEEPVVAREPAHVIALRELEELARKDYARKGLIKEYFVEISSIVRRYLEGRFSVHAPEMTTEEFLRDVRDDSLLADAHKKLLEDLLLCCDLVKFARYAPESAEIQGLFDAAKRFVEQTQPST